MKTITFPKSANSNQTSEVIDTEGVIVVVGANGSGKTRLGSWIEFSSDYADKVHRISAQKSLSMPKSIRPQSTQLAEYQLIYGIKNEQQMENCKDKQQILNFKRGQRWGQNPETNLLNDFEQLLVYLFSENYERLIQYKNEVNQSPTKLEPPITKLDRIKKIWEYILPHRELVIHSGSIQAKVKSDNKEYNAAEMSDGERIIFYLIGECLSAPKEGIIVIDEPEIHLHKSIQRKLWDSIETERDDCIFIYLTHDLDFATKRFNSTKICLKSYNGEEFDWYKLHPENEIPESVYLEVIGSRSPVLFVEGTKGSYDTQIYQYIYPDFTIEPVGSCTQVVNAVKVFNNNNLLHHIKAYGIIDRDHKDSQELNKYKEKNIFTPEVAEVENLLLIEQVLLTVAKELYVDNPQDTVNQIKQWVINKFNDKKYNYALNRASYRLNTVLNGLHGKVNSIKELESNRYELLNNTPTAFELYNQALQEADKIIQNNNYDEVLKVFNEKGLLSEVSKFFGLRSNEYSQKVKNIIRHSKTHIIDHLKDKMPSL